MRSVRQEIGGLGNLLFKEAYIWGQMREGKIPDIYVQSEEYWERYKDEIRTRFSAGIHRIDKVAIHIRRGDYLKAHQFHTNLWDTGYYKNAVKLFPNEKFLVFCKDNQSEAQDEDDRIWCMDNMPFLLPSHRYELYNHSSETEDLNAMAGCKAIIGANSSFSWWAAYLGDTTKAVIMPHEDHWFTDGKHRTELPKHWTKII